MPTATSANIAELNLDFSITQGRQFIAQQPAAGEAARALVSALLLRARNRNSFEDFDEALGVATNITTTHPADPLGWLALASARVALHRFDAAIKSVDEAAKRGAEAGAIAAQRGAIAIARGKARDTLPQIAAAARTTPGYATHSAHAIALQELGRTTEADAAYAAALTAYDDVSPYAIAWVFFQRGVLWTDVDNAKARSFYTNALGYLPNNITTNVHLAELEHAAGDTAAALARMERIAPLSKDPEPMGFLAELLTATGRAAEAAPWLARAKARYRELLAKHRLAFADHGAEFYSGIGGDPAQALALAEENLANRRTRRAFEITIDAARAAKSGARLCALASSARAAGHRIAVAECP